MYGYHRGGIPVIIAIAAALSDDGRYNRSMAIMAMDDLRFVIEQHDQVETALLQQDIHGKIVKMSLSLNLPGFALRFFPGVGIDPLFLEEALGFQQIDLNPVLNSVPDSDPLSALQIGIVHDDIEFQQSVRLKGIRQPAEAQFLRIHEPVAGQHHAYSSIVPAGQRLGQLGDDVFNAAGASQTTIFPTEHPN